MASAFNLRKQMGKKVSPKGPEALPEVPGMGQLPFQPGALVLSPDEREDLEKLGWKDGDPLPGGLAEQLEAARAKIRQEVVDEARRLARSGRKPVAAPEAVPIESLPPDKREELHKLVQDSKHVATHEIEELQRKMWSTVDPKFKKVLENLKSMEVTDSRQDPTVVSRPKAPAGLGQPTLAPESASEPQSETTPKTTPEPTGACQHCGWDATKQPDSIEPTYQDKLNFVTATFQAQGYFVKQYEFFGGRLRATFRHVPVSHAEIALTQVSADVRDGKAVTSDDFWRLLMDYRTLLGLSTVTVGGQVYEIGRQVDEVLKGPVGEGDTPTPLPDVFRALVLDGPLANESVWRVLGTNWKRFNRLVEALEARADDESFWPAIGD